MVYAVKTKVPVDRTIGEIRKIIEKAGASGFAFAEEGMNSYVVFKFENRVIKMFLRFPPPPNKSSTELSKKTWEQIRKSRWRSFLLCIKAKIEAIESNIETFDEAFLPHIMLHNGSTVGQKMISKIEELNEKPASLMLGL